MLVCILPIFALANPYAVQGNDRIGTIPSREGGDFVTVHGFTSAGICPDSQGKVAINVQDTSSGCRAMTILLAAKLTDQEICISVDENKKNPNVYCYIYAVELAS